MSVGEFELIQRYFARPELSGSENTSSETLLGIGDDCSLLSVPSGMQLAQSLDTLVEGVHFPYECDPYALGYRSLAVTLSDLASMGAEPHSFSMGLTLPVSSEDWLQSFSNGLSTIALKEGVVLIGGDTSRGSLTLSLQVQGMVPRGSALLRRGARPGDLIYVTGTLGDSAGALPFVLTRDGVSEDDSVLYLRNRFWFPSPRIYAGQWLRLHRASAAVDVSDGLLGDLGHILRSSEVGADIIPERIPCSEMLIEVYGLKKAQQFALSGGDDYELCFTMAQKEAELLPAVLDDGCRITCIGRINDESGVIRGPSGNVLKAQAYTHF